MFHRVDPAKEYRFHLVLNQLNKGYKPMAVECSLRVLPRWSYQCLLQTARSNFPPNPAQEARHEAPKAAKQAKPSWILGKPWECIENCCQSGWWASGPVPIVQENPICHSSSPSTMSSAALVRRMDSDLRRAWWDSLSPSICRSFSMTVAPRAPSLPRINYSFGFMNHCPSVNQYNPFLLLLNVPQILKTGVHLQFQKISDWPIWLLVDPL